MGLECKAARSHFIAPVQSKRKFGNHSVLQNSHPGDSGFTVEPDIPLAQEALGRVAMGSFPATAAQVPPLCEPVRGGPDGHKVERAPREPQPRCRPDVRVSRTSELHPKNCPTA